MSTYRLRYVHTLRRVRSTGPSLLLKRRGKGVYMERCMHVSFAYVASAVYSTISGIGLMCTWHMHH